MNVLSAIERGITSNTQAIYTLYIGSIYPVHWIYISCVLELYPQLLFILEAPWSQIWAEHSPLQ